MPVSSVLRSSKEIESMHDSDMAERLDAYIKVIALNILIKISIINSKSKRHSITFT